MTRYAALLRGIAPSGKNQSNEQLRGVFERLGFAKVASVLASGNIVFDSTETDVPRLENSIEEALVADLDLNRNAIVRSLAELRALLASDPFEGLIHQRGTYLTVTFFKDAPTVELITEHPDGLTKVVGYDPDARAVLAIIDNSDPGKTPDFMQWLEKAYGKSITTRTWLTVERIVRKLESR